MFKFKKKKCINRYCSAKSYGERGLGWTVQLRKQVYFFTCSLRYTVNLGVFLPFYPYTIVDVPLETLAKVIQTNGRFKVPDSNIF